MKKLIYSTFGLLLIGSLILNGCKPKDKEPDPTPAAPKPIVTFTKTTGYTFADKKALNSGTEANLKFGMIVNSTIDLKTITVSRKFSTSPTEVIFSKTLGSNLKTFTMDILDTLETGLKGGYVYTFTAINKDNTKGESSITVTATGPLYTIDAERVYSNKSTTKESAYDLVLGDPLLISDNNNVGRRDIIDNSTTSSLAKEWIAGPGTQTLFIKGGFDKTYSQLQTEADVKALWDKNAAKASTKLTGMTGLGLMVLVKIVRASAPVYMVMTIDDIVDGAGVDNDYTVFSYKY